MKERIVKAFIAGEERPIMYENENGYYECIMYDEYGRIVYFETPDGSESWEYLMDSELFTKHTYANGVEEYWQYNFARQPLLRCNNIGYVEYTSPHGISDWLIHGSTSYGHGMVLAHHVNRTPMFILKYGKSEFGSGVVISEYKHDYPKSILLKTNGYTVGERATRVGSLTGSGVIFSDNGDKIGDIEISVNNTKINLAYNNGDYLINKLIVMDTFTGEILCKEESLVKLSRKEKPCKICHGTTSKLYKGPSKSPTIYADGYDDDTIPQNIINSFREFIESNEF